MAGLDPVTSAALRGDLTTLAYQEGVTVFLTTHNLLEAERWCHWVGILDKGHLRATGSPLEIKEKTGSASFEDAFMRLTEEA